MAKPFYDPNSRLTKDQCEAIGRVALHWSLLEYALERILVRLAFAPDFPGMALTNDLSINNRLVALKSLTDIHRYRYDPSILSEQQLQELDDIRKQITKLKDRRNRIVHYVWFRRDDQKMFGIRFRGKVPTKDPHAASHEILRINQADKISEEIETSANQMLEISRSLAEIPETSPDKSRLRIERRPRAASQPRKVRPDPP